MQLSSSMTEDSLRQAFERAALETWGSERLEALRDALAGSAHAAFLVLQQPLGSLDDEPDFPPRSARVGAEANPCSSTS
jgi:hypothetical protein